MKRVIVIGGGASGLAAALSAAENGAAVTVLERLPRVGKKILLTGNGRCNLGHMPADAAHYHGTLPFAKQIISQFDTVAYFRRYGLFTRTDSLTRRRTCQWPCLRSTACLSRSSSSTTR